MQARDVDRLLCSAMERGSPAVRRLLEAVERADAKAQVQSWLAVLVDSERLPSRPGESESEPLLLGGEVVEEADELSRIVKRARSLHKDPSTPVLETDHADLLDLGAALDEPWASFFAGAALKIEEPPCEAESEASGGLADYRLLEPIGSGGAGAVYRAIQRGTRREVALKLLRPEVVSEETIARLVREAELLSKLSHEGIATVYTTGFYRSLAETDLPYLAMELVDGVAITRFVQERRLELPEVLSLFAKVLDAVRHAHDRGVLHRDLHPGNLLVERDGTPKVLDFGIARSLHADTTLTVTGALLGTLSYMSPEQALGQKESVDERSDVYSLGVVLHELLVGRPPHELEGLPVAEAIHVVAHEDADGLDLISERGGRDLQLIVSTAIARDRELRYASVRAFDEDLRCYRRGLPVHARPPTTAYLVSKLVARHRALLVTACIALVLFLIGGAWATVGWRRAARAEDGLLSEAKVTEEVLDLTLSLAGDLSERVGADELLLSSLLTIRALLAESPTAGTPESSRHARVGEVLGDAALRAGRLDEAARYRREVRAFYEELVVEHPDDRVLQAALSVAVVKEGDLCKARGDHEGARTRYERALVIDRELAEATGEIGHLDNLCWSQMRLNRLDESLQTVQQLLELDPERILTGYAASTVYLLLGERFVAQGDRREGLLHGETALAHARAVHAQEPNRRSFAEVLGYALRFVGRQRSHLGRSEAIDDLAEALAVFERLSSREKQNVDVRRMLARIRMDLGHSQEKFGRPEAAARSYSMARALMEAAQGGL